MATQIIDSVATLKIVRDGVTKLLVKTQIKEISIVATNQIKLDTGQGIYNTFISYPDVTAPVTADVEALRDAINAMLTTGAAGGGATEAKQDSQIGELQNIKAGLDALSGKVDTLSDRVFLDALLVDEATPNTIYKGYGLPGASTSAAVWAIEKVTVNNDVVVRQWAGGNKTLDKIWDDRASLTYA